MGKLWVGEFRAETSPAWSWRGPSAPSDCCLQQYQSKVEFGFVLPKMLETTHRPQQYQWLMSHPPAQSVRRLGLGLAIPFHFPLLILLETNDLLRRLRYTCADFHSNCHAAPYRSCDSAHFDDHQLHDDLQFAGGQLSNSLSYPRRVVWNGVVWNHDIERYGKYSVFVNVL